MNSKKPEKKLLQIFGTYSNLIILPFLIFLSSYLFLVIFILLKSLTKRETKK
jgi:hypothetical protein